MIGFVGLLVAATVLLGWRGIAGAWAHTGNGWQVGTADGPIITVRSHLDRLPGWVPWMATGVMVGAALLGAPGAVLGAVTGVVGITFLKRRRAAKAAALRDEQLADAVRTIAAALRAGLSVSQALAFAAGETPAPLREPLRGAVDALDLGLPLDDVLDGWTQIVDTEDARLLAGVLMLHRRSGGDLPMVLDQVAATLRERRSAARELRALTAQARLSGVILGLLPIGFFGFLWLTSRSDIEGAFRTPAGIAAISTGLTLELIAFLWIRHLLAVA